MQSIQALHLRLFRGDDQHPANLVGNIVLAAELHHLADAGDGEFGSCCPWPVGKSAVQNTAVIPCLMTADRRFFFQDSDLVVGIALAKTPGRSETDNAAAKDQDLHKVSG